MKGIHRLVSAAALLAALGGARAASDVVISQVYGGGGNSGSIWKNDFIELYNRGSVSVSLSGWSVQYASTTGSTWQVTQLSGSIAPGQHYLVQEAAGTGAAPALPTPDATGSIAMSATVGKVALSSSTTALSGTTPVGAAVIDRVAFGTNSSQLEGTPTGSISAATAAIRKGAGSVDTDSNSTDFVVATPIPRNSAAPAVTAFRVGVAVHSAPVAYQGNVYFGADDGKLYGYAIATGAALPGFPYVVPAGADSKVLSRPALRYVAGQVRLFFTSADGRAFCVNLDGTQQWATTPLLGGAAAVQSTPAIAAAADETDATPRDYAFVAEGSGTDARIFKLRADTGALVRASAAPIGLDVKSSPAAGANSIYVGVKSLDASSAGILRVDPYDLMPRATLAAGQTVDSAPFIYGPTAGGAFPDYPVAFIASNAGAVYGVNATNGAELPSFPVTVTAGAALSNVYLYSDALYVGGGDNKVYKLALSNIAAGAATVYDAAGTSKAISGGVTVDPSGLSGAGSLVFGSTDGVVYQTALSGAPATGRALPILGLTAFTAPTVDTVNHTVLIGADDGAVYVVPQY